MNILHQVQLPGLPLLSVKPSRILVSQGLRKRIVKWVIIVHVVGVLVPALWFGIRQWLMTRNPSIIRVQLVADETISEPDFSSQSPEPPRQDSPSPSPAPKPHQTQPKPNPRKWRPRSASDITVSKDLLRNDQSPDVSAGDIEKRLKNITRKLQVSNASNSGSQAPSSYYDSIAGYLYRLWQQPSRAELGGRNPVVGVQLSISADGTIGNAKITRASGIAPMDNSVRQLLENLHQLPRPPNGAMTLDISLEVVD